MEALFTHDRAHEFEIDVHLVIGQQGCADSATTVGAAGALVDLGDRVGHDEAADLAVGHRPSAMVLQ